MKKPLVPCLVAGGLLLLVTSGHAESLPLDSAGLFDSLLNRFAKTASGWGERSTGYASRLFFSLALISMVWTYGFMALRKADLQEFMAETIRFVVVTGFFYWLLIHGPAIATALMDSLRQIAAEASGLNHKVSPSGIVDIGFDIAAKAIDRSSVWSPASTTVGLLSAAVILIILALVGVNLLITLISAWVIAFGGVIVLGFGGGRWTQDIAIQYYRTVLGIGMQSFAMVLLIGIGKSFIDQYYAAIGNDPTLKELWVMLVVSLILLMLINKIPPMLAAMVGGGGGGGGSSVGLGAAMGAAGLASAALSGGAGMAANAMAQMSGAGSALQAAFKAAQAAGLGNSQEGAGEGSGAGGLSKGLQTLASAGAHLSAGAFEVVKESVSAAKEAFSERLDDTFGGKVAQSINAASETATPNGSQEPDSQKRDAGKVTPFPEGSLSAEVSMEQEEINRFVNGGRY